MAKTKRNRKSKPGNTSSEGKSIIPKGPIWVPKEGADRYINHEFVNTTSIFSIQGNVVSPILGGQYVQLNQLSNYALYTALFDQYRIDMVEVTFNLKNNPGSGTGFGRLNVFPDFDDATAPASLANAQSHPRVMRHVFTPTQPTFTFSFQPRLAVAAYGGAFTKYTSPSSKVYVDSSNADAQHYGYKYAIENFTDTNNYIEVIYRVWLTMRSPL
jgi:hypothetical protein